MEVIEDRSSTASGLKALLQEPVPKAELKKRLAGDPMAKRESRHRLANRQFIVSFGNAMPRGAGVDLKRFVPSLPVGALSTSETRHFVKVQCADGATATRSVIVDSVSGGRRFEVPTVISGGIRQTPVLHMVLDQGSIGWLGMMWCVHKAPIRSTITFDGFHRLVNDYLAGISSFGLCTTRYEWCTVLSLRSGPFQKSAHHWTLTQAAAEFFDRCDEKCVVFDYLYADIARDKGMTGDQGFGTDAHIRKVWLKKTEVCGPC